ncbi:hypothetical protein GLOIN_2v1790636 [Rhizophagus irregularis DAOM 181602=DAOM 197198]|nr:hypothetical protein GLOIN_2v1790636 [Rhizophagus irregularis DAOM 181602=DAOM 197198]
MSDNITNTYAMVEEQTKLTMESMSLTNEILDYANTRINQLESNLNFIKLLACHRDWIKMFIVKSTIQLGEEQLKDADDIKLLCELKNYSNTLFHKNNQTIEQAKAQLNDLLPERMRIYEFLLQKALKAISFWRK